MLRLRHLPVVEAIELLEDPVDCNVGIAHDQAGAAMARYLIGLGYKKAAFKFAHNAVHKLDKHNLLMVNSYHTSRYNINTGVLTPDMFRDVIKNILNLLK